MESSTRRQAVDRMIERHFRFEAEDDVDGVLGTMTEDVEHEVVGAPSGPLHGQAAARGFYEHLGWVLEEGATNIEWIADFRLLELLYRIDLSQP